MKNQLLFQVFINFLVIATILTTACVKRHRNVIEPARKEIIK